MELLVFVGVEGKYGVGNGKGNEESRPLKLPRPPPFVQDSKNLMTQRPATAELTGL